MSAFLAATGLVKSYDERRVVDALSLSCAEGEVLGLLGPNGAGKTTTLRMLYGFIDPEAGEIRYEGKLFSSHRTELKRLIGVCTQDDTLDYDFSVRQNLSVYASYFRPSVAGLDARVTELLARFGLDEYADASPHALSGGF
jgi:lipooligosaccharide transport system ATP-binding protein